MSLVKVIEVLAEGNSVENAIENALDEAKETLHGIKSIYVKDINALVEDNNIVRYRLILNISFLLDE
jgi:dodecin